MSVKLELKYLDRFITSEEYEGIAPQVKRAHELLHNGEGLGCDFLGWRDLPKTYDKSILTKINESAKKIRRTCEVFIVVGIGGSYLGARAAIEFLFGTKYNELSSDRPKIYFVGNSVSASELSDVIKLCEGKDVILNVISKSGTTTEPAIAFRILKKFMEDKYGTNEASSRIYCTTDESRGALKNLANKEGYVTFVIPDDVGGRFSVLTPVGLLPIAVAGANINDIIHGASRAMDDFQKCDLDENDCYKYAAIRNILYRKQKSVELLASYEPSFTMMGEWFKQLFGESEGKDHKGLFPASVTFSTDLHSMGQFIQDGSRIMFETVVNIKNTNDDIVILSDEQDLDGLNFLAGKSMSYVNEKAFEGTALAHVQGGVPVIVINVENRSEEDLGYLIYFFEKACAVSGYVLGVNPFNQPGVEQYKKNMFELLGKPGFTKGGVI